MYTARTGGAAALGETGEGTAGDPLTPPSCHEGPAERWRAQVPGKLEGTGSMLVIISFPQHPSSPRWDKHSVCVLDNQPLTQRAQLMASPMGLIMNTSITAAFRLSASFSKRRRQISITQARVKRFIPTSGPWVEVQVSPGHGQLPDEPTDSPEALWWSRGWGGSSSILKGREWAGARGTADPKAPAGARDGSRGPTRGGCPWRSQAGLVTRDGAAGGPGDRSPSWPYTYRDWEAHSGVSWLCPPHRAGGLWG